MIEQFHGFPDITPESLELEQAHIRDIYPRIAARRPSVLQLKPHDNGHFLAAASGCVIGFGEMQWLMTANHVRRPWSDVLIYITVGDHNVYTSTSWRRSFALSPIDITMLPLPEELYRLVPSIPFAQTCKGSEEVYLVGYPAINDNINKLKDRTPTIHPSSVRKFTYVGMVIDAHSPIGDVHGLSGGAVLNKQGELIGIPYCIPESGDVAAVSIDNIRNAITSYTKYIKLLGDYKW